MLVLQNVENKPALQHHIPSLRIIARFHRHILFEVMQRRSDAQTVMLALSFQIEHGLYTHAGNPGFIDNRGRSLHCLARARQRENHIRNLHAIA